MLTIPKILDTPEFYDAPLDYKWNEDIFRKWRFEADNDRLNEAFLKINHKAAMGLTAAMAEWIFWRLHCKVELTPVILTLEPLWAGIIDKRYIVSWNYANRGETDHIGGVKRLALSFIQQIRINYTRGLYSVNGYMDSLAIVARHISPDKKLFDVWLNDCIKRTLALFPVPYDYRNPAAYGEDGQPFHDSSNEPPIPREFFFTEGFDYETADIPRLLNDYLSKLSWEENDLLTPPDEMLAKGFEGTPYKYEPK